MFGGTAGQRFKLCANGQKEAALSIVCSFAGDNGWSKLVYPLRTVEVYVAPDRAALLGFLQEAGEVDDSDNRMLLAVALDNNIIVVDETEFLLQRPEYIALQQGWLRIIAHEFVHLLHNAIVDGKHDELGPQWFFEGFACLGAGQNLGWTFVDNSTSAIIATLREVEGRERYPVFEAALRIFAERHGLPELIERARRPNFEAWLCDRG